MSMPAKVEYPPPPLPAVDPKAENEGPPSRDESLQSSTEVILATAGYSNSINLWEAHTGKLLKSLTHPCSYVTALEISPDGSLLVAGGYQAIKIYDTLKDTSSSTANSNNEESQYPKLRKNVMDVGFPKDSKWMYVAGDDGVIQIWDLRSLENVRYQMRHSLKSASVNSVELHPNQQELIIGDSLGNITIWNLKADKAETWTPSKESVINDIALHPSGNQMAFVNNTGSCHVLPLKAALPENEGLKTCIDMDTRAGIPAHKKYALRCKYSPNGKILATTSADQSTKIWDADDFSLIKELKVEGQRWVWDLSFSLDSQYLFTASSDNLARLWSLDSGEVMREYTGHQNALTCLAFRDVKAAP